MSGNHSTAPYVDRHWTMLKIHVMLAFVSALSFFPLVFLDHWKVALVVPVVILGAFEVYCRGQRTHAIYHL